MKVEQLKAELVVFKGLMSNVSSACLPLLSGCAWPALPCAAVPAPSHPGGALPLPQASFSRQTAALLQRRRLGPPHW